MQNEAKTLVCLLLCKSRYEVNDTPTSENSWRTFFINLCFCATKTDDCPWKRSEKKWCKQVMSSWKVPVWCVCLICERLSVIWFFFAFVLLHFSIFNEIFEIFNSFSSGKLRLISVFFGAIKLFKLFKFFLQLP